MVLKDIWSSGHYISKLYWHSVGHSEQNTKVDREIDMARLHRRHILDPLNIRISTMVKKVWDRLEQLEDSEFTDILEITNNTQGDT